MSRTKVRLTTENTDSMSKERTDTFPYDYFKNNHKLRVVGFNKLVIYDFEMYDPSRVEICWDVGTETTNIFNGFPVQTFDIPKGCREIIFVLDAYTLGRHPMFSKDRIAEFEFNLIRED